MNDTASIEAMASRADRSMRTFAARNIARHALEILGEKTTEGDLFDALASSRSWSRVDDKRFTCAFGDRRMTITVPIPFNAAAMVRLVVRTEVNVCLGDADPTLLAGLHSIAQRELTLAHSTSTSS